MNEFQSNANRDGREYHAACVAALERYGFKVNQSNLRVVDCGVDVDIVAENGNGIVFLVECKGGWNRGTKKGGMASSDNVRKAIASGYCLAKSETHTGHPFTPLIVMAPYMADPKSVNYTQLSVTSTRELLDIVSDRDHARLKRWQAADYYAIEAHIATCPTVIASVEANSFWGIPVQAPALWRMTR